MCIYIYIYINVYKNIFDLQYIFILMKYLIYLSVKMVVEVKQNNLNLF